jgi:hypothetical protein
VLARFFFEVTRVEFDFRKSRGITSLSLLFLLRCLSWGHHLDLI